MAWIAVAGGVYGLVLLAYALYSLYAFHHLSEFGYSSDMSQRMFRVYGVLTLAILLATSAVALVGLGSR